MDCKYNLYLTYGDISYFILQNKEQVNFVSNKAKKFKFEIFYFIKFDKIT